jgi:hypothetical protein
MAGTDGKQMKVLIACEFSGTVRDAFIRHGHDAMSCDLLPTEQPGPHYQGDVMDIINTGWDLMIGHPPCTYLSYAATRVWNEPGREEKRRAALKFFIDLYNAPIHYVCIENPHGIPRIEFRQPDQEIHPYYFGDPQMKRTCLWLKNLPALIHYSEDTLFGKRTHVEKPEPSFTRKDGNKQYYCSTTRSPKERARFWPGIAEAMAMQWGDFILARQDAESDKARHCI